MKDADIVLFLFDVDGVIVEPLAYKEGIIKGMEVLCSDLGLANAASFAPSHSEIAYMESKGVHDVWDMCNMMFALVLENVFRSQAVQPDLSLSSDSPSSTDDVPSILREIISLSPRSERPDYNKFIDELIPTTSSAHPPDLAFSYLSQRINNSSWNPLLGKFLKSTRSAYDSYGTRIFQNIILGGEEFEKNYGLKSAYTGASLLRTIDKVLMSEESAAQLMALSTVDKYRIAIYTARPSLAPPDVPAATGYSPEAEIAAESAHVDCFPLVGMGMMEWLAAQHAERVEDLTKPNTTHALSAMLAAVNQNNDSRTLERAYQFDRNKGDLPPPQLSELAGKKIHAYVFEDTSSGIKPMLANAQTLNALGYQITVSPLGIATDENKKSALSILCEKVFPDVNQALAHALRGKD